MVVRPYHGRPILIDTHALSKSGRSDREVYLHLCLCPQCYIGRILALHEPQLLLRVLVRFCDAAGHQTMKADKVVISQLTVRLEQAKSADNYNAGTDGSIPSRMYTAFGPFTLHSKVKLIWVALLCLTPKVLQTGQHY